MRACARGAVLAVLLSAVVLVSQVLGGAARAREFRAADTQTADYPTVQALLTMDRLVRERTGGRHSIKVFHSRQLGEEKETIEQTRVGAIDINRSSTAPFASFVPEAGVLALPYLFRSVEHLHKVLDGPIGDEILASFEAYGFVGLAFYDSGARSFYNTVRPIRVPADMAGLRIRVQQSDQMIAMIRLLGAEAIALPYGQVTTGLSTGIVDGAENNWPSYVSTDHVKLARFHSATEHTMTPEVLVMSARAWAALDAADRQIFRQAARESALYMRQQWFEWEGRSRAAARGAGAVLTEGVDKKAFADAVAPLYEQFVPPGRLRDLVERIRMVE
ncbi:TRAP transporter substrate-binding protein [Prosthecomicrobium hirschii]|uniref:TRAP transporter substrate-binding protein n=1 Tax=Prosthecodimorpha hirschii TaxID=665126 RepID=UPI002220EEDC|nr:TRAP transporter substrate-binding protein [Prosthecomicrobium hirschii]MCW1839567.1 TRAP transporter substrate-binding protein [Prosthecomicrobium hirschii]